ncbi:MAG: phytanoyl-CoA dioxygenase family protein [Anaerolineae bacterium]
MTHSQELIEKNALVQHFDEHGFVVVENVFDAELDFQPLIDDYAELLNSLAEQWLQQGKLSATYRELPFAQQFAQIVRELKDPWYQHFDFSLPQEKITPQTPIHLSAPIFKLMTHPKLLDVVELFVGSEILVNPVHHVRIKPPEGLITHRETASTLTLKTEWHQDQGVVLPEADETTILTVWLPLVDTTIENGCLCVIPGTHKGELVTHCPGIQTHIPEKLLPGQPIALPIKKGSVLLMHRRTIHSSLTNHSTGIRWSFDLRYQPLHQPTGRPDFPAFIARSQQHPEKVMTDYRLWQQLWLDTRERLAERDKPKFQRWNSDAPACA